MCPAYAGQCGDDLKWLPPSCAYRLLAQWPRSLLVASAGLRRSGERACGREFRCAAGSAFPRTNSATKTTKIASSAGPPACRQRARGNEPPPQYGRLTPAQGRWPASLCARHLRRTNAQYHLPRHAVSNNESRSGILTSRYLRNSAGVIDANVPAIPPIMQFPRSARTGRGARDHRRHHARHVSERAGANHRCAGAADHRGPCSAISRTCPGWWAPIC